MVDLTKYVTVSSLMERLTRLQELGYGDLPVVMGEPRAVTNYLVDGGTKPDSTHWDNLFGVTAVMGASNRQDGQKAVVMMVDPWTTAPGGPPDVI